MRAASSFYCVEITTGSGPYVSRTFRTIRAARLWAKRCAQTWPTRIFAHGTGEVTQ